MARGVKEARKHLPREYLAKFFRSTCKQAIQGHREFTQVQAARRLKALLLHVWIEWFIMVWLTRWILGEKPEGGG